MLLAIIGCILKDTIQGLWLWDFVSFCYMFLCNSNIQVPILQSPLLFTNSVLTWNQGMQVYDIITNPLILLQCYIFLITQHHVMACVYDMIIIYFHYTLCNSIPIHTCNSHPLVNDTSNHCFSELYQSFSDSLIHLRNTSWDSPVISPWLSLYVWPTITQVAARL